MSTYILMKILESSPDRYNCGIKILTFGKLDKVYDRLTSRIGEGQIVLDIGCGTGALSLRAARRGARVKGIDVNSQMLEIAQKKAEELGLALNVGFVEMGVVELEKEKANSYDAVMSGLCFSELGDDELDFTLREIIKILKPGGVLLVADEVVPEGIAGVISRIVRIPFAILAYIFAQTTSKPVRNLKERIESAGFKIELIKRSGLGDFIEIVARKPVSEET